MTGLAADSRSLAAGEVFLAYPGSRRDGREFIPAALQRGAAAVLWEREGFEWNPGWRVPNLGVENLRGLLRFFVKHRGLREAERARRLLLAALWFRSVTFRGARGRSYRDGARFLASGDVRSLLS